MHFYEFVVIFLYAAKLRFLGGNNLGQICHLMRELLDQLPTGQIDLYLPFILEYHKSLAKSRIFLNVSNFLKNRPFCENLGQSSSQLVTCMGTHKIDSNSFLSYQKKKIRQHLKILTHRIQGEKSCALPSCLSRPSTHREIFSKSY